MAAGHLDVAKEHLEVDKEYHQQVLDRLPDQEKECLRSFRLTRDDRDDSYEWHKDKIEERLEGTYNWILSHDSYTNWLDKDSGLLVVSADPGCGKSVLAKYMVDSRFGGYQKSATICYFFFRDQLQNTQKQALCALLHQLLIQRPSLIKHALGKYKSDGEKLVNVTNSLWEILRNVATDPETGPVIFLVDALDECKESELIELIAGLKRHFLEDKMEMSQVKIFLTSRPYDQVISQFAGFIRKSPHIHISGEHDSETIAEEVNIVVKHRVQVLQNEGKLKGPIANHLEEKLLKMRHRTYLWVYIVFAYLQSHRIQQKITSVESVVDVILPSNIFQSYEKILSKSEDIQQARKAFCAILAASRQLTVTEMNVVVHVDLESQGISDIDADEDFEQTLRGWCGLLISISQGKVYLLHQTVHEFLDQRALTHENHGESAPMPIQKTEACSFLAKSCIGYISAVAAQMEDSWWASDSSMLYIEHSFLPYANTNMVDHFNQGGIEEGLVLAMENLCDPHRRECQL